MACPTVDPDYTATVGPDRDRGADHPGVCRSCGIGRRHASAATVHRLDPDRGVMAAAIPVAVVVNWTTACEVGRAPMLRPGGAQDESG